MSQPISGSLPLPPYGELSFDHDPYCYAIFDAAGSLLYVGVTEQIRKRLNSHYHRSRRVGSGDYLKYRAVKYVTRADAEREEALVIRAARPRDNKAEGTGRFPR